MPDETALARGKRRGGSIAPNLNDKEGGKFFILDLFGKCNSHLEKASFVSDAVWAPLSKWRGGGGEAVQNHALPFSQRVFSEEVYFSNVSGFYADMRGNFFTEQGDLAVAARLRLAAAHH